MALSIISIVRSICKCGGSDFKPRRTGVIEYGLPADFLRRSIWKLGVIYPVAQITVSISLRLLGAIALPVVVIV